jgi:hypothetical protein
MSIEPLSIQHVEQWRRVADTLASGNTRDGKHKRFQITPDGWAYIYVGTTLLMTYTELQSAITAYNEL